MKEEKELLKTDGKAHKDKTAATGNLRGGTNPIRSYRQILPKSVLAKDRKLQTKKIRKTSSNLIIPFNLLSILGKANSNCIIKERNDQFFHRFCEEKKKKQACFFPIKSLKVWQEETLDLFFRDYIWFLLSHSTEDIDLNYRFIIGISLKLHNLRMISMKSFFFFPQLCKKVLQRDAISKVTEGACWCVSFFFFFPPLNIDFLSCRLHYWPRKLSQVHKEHNNTV